MSNLKFKSGSPPQKILVTPKMAEAWVKNRATNRPISVSSVETYCRLINAGLFRLTHQGIAFRESDGRLVDAQHRLLAVQITGKSVWMYATIIDDEAAEAIDGGRVRNPGDRLSISHGVAQGGRVKAVTQVLHYLMTSQSAALQPSEVMAIMEYARDVFAWATPYFTSHKGTGSLSGAPVLGACMFAYYNDPEAVDAFYNELHEGANLRAGSPILVLRETILRSPKNTSNAARVERSRLTLTAISKYMSKETVRLLRPPELLTLRAKFLPAWHKQCGPWPITNEFADKIRQMLPGQTKLKGV